MDAAAEAVASRVTLAVDSVADSAAADSVAADLAAADLAAADSVAEAEELHSTSHLEMSEVLYSISLPDAMAK